MHDKDILRSIDKHTGEYALEEKLKAAIDALQAIRDAALKGDETTAELECFHLADDFLNSW